MSSVGNRGPERSSGIPKTTWHFTDEFSEGRSFAPQLRSLYSNSVLTEHRVLETDLVIKAMDEMALTIRNGGNVLVPCYPSGVIYDLLECLYQYIDSAGLSSIPFYFISPVANSSLEFSQIFAEWLCHNKQTKVYLPEPPFPHAELIQTNKLKHYPSIHGDFSNDFRQPCVVFTGHPSLRFGDVVHFMELWGKSSLNTVIFTEPDFSYLEALAPYQPLAMKCIYCPIDTRLNFIQVSKLLKEVQPLHVVCPEQYTQPPPAQSHRLDLMVDCQPPAMAYRRAEVLTLPFKRRYEKIEIMPELADSLVPMEVKPGISLASVSAVLHTKDNKHVLQLPPRPAQPTGGKKRKRGSDDIPDCKVLKPLLSGSIPVEQFVQTLEKVSALCVPRLNCHPSCCSWSPCIRDVRCFLLSVHCQRLSPKHLLGPGSQPGEQQAGALGLREECAFLPAPGSQGLPHHPSPLWERGRGKALLQPHRWDRVGEARTKWDLPLPEPCFSARRAQPGHVTGDERLWAELRRTSAKSCRAPGPADAGLHGFSDIKVEDTAKGHIVLLQEAETLIQIEEDSTHIICDNDEMLRVRLRDLVLKFLQKF
ncbi:hypothetical protein MC885_012001 [Smutsia gigantea]|nr:hypothetical protein MC885_012001 [Smutsia gigantea]